MEVRFFLSAIFFKKGELMTDIEPHVVEDTNLDVSKVFEIFDAVQDDNILRLNGKIVCIVSKDLSEDKLNAIKNIIGE